MYKIVPKIFQIMKDEKRGKNSWDKTYICTLYSPSKNSYEGSATIPDKEMTPTYISNIHFLGFIPSKV